MTRVATRTPVLGTVVEVRLDGEPEAVDLAEQFAWRTFEELQAVFSVFDPRSELCRWRTGAIDTVSTELRTVLAAAEHWHVRSRGAFHPATGALTRRWRRAEQDGVLPSADELATLVTPLPFAVTADTVHRTGDCSEVDLNAIAKGFIVDQACTAALIPGVQTVVINAGGDLRHVGQGAATIGIEDPGRPYDNLPPRWKVSVSNSALATSGNARRGFQVGSQWLGHVLDPRTGWPVAHTASISVLADDAMTADVLATVLGVPSPTEALVFADQEHIGALLVEADGTAHLSASWPA
ncbi:MAG: FAD:protein FMN transferase [Propionibacteriales bacterium]|nr:FAD:protein FMN transferase [Propionibacteriales bacterium]